MNRDIHNLIAREYEKRQKQAADTARQRKEDLYAKIPQLIEIDDQINKLGIKYNRLILSSDGNASALSSELANSMASLIERKTVLLKNNGINADYLKPQYQCANCSDTGYISGSNGFKRCSCYKQQIISHLFSSSNITPAGDECFRNFNELLYPDEINPNKYGIAVSPRENIKNIKLSCINFTKNIDAPKQKNLFFSGRTGVGKTFLSFCIARELINQGRTVLYLTAPALFDIINEYKMKAYKEVNFDDDRYKSIFSVELLVIDDLGTETLSDARYAELLNILNTRQSRDSVSACKTIISTNMGPKKLYELYTERITSRIMGYFDRLVLAGRDIRSENL
ncbi:DNA replication protein DnaC [Ruminiclostridium sufflavum DSM 19573]|uniref:DNA replication protein DnaC n=1 Tax=Ruminiclostridium sufflavum DSM 19573 TaxID=1121337 RepID=A0A318XPQ6_9FIRM|nr:ATP-binding protein [Ruminiclostridium sufflavum]PYG89035.1 DNA replication protein DnaC [Ruminiclostridium sufflavum DSM 19573]